MKDHIAIGQRLIKLPGVRIAYDAQHDTGSLALDAAMNSTRYESVPLDDPSADTFTHYLKCDDDNLSEDDEFNLSYYNACAWGEETRTLPEQAMLVAKRFGL